MTYASIPIETSPDGIEQALYAALAEAFPGWEPAEGNVEVWIARWLSQQAPDLAELLAEVGDEVFRTYGAVTMGIPPVEGAPATGTVTITFVDDAGYTLPDGVQFDIAVAGDERVGFTLDEGGEVPPGLNPVPGVPVTATVAGAAGNGISGEAELIDALDFIESIVFDAPTAGGVDPEDDEAYLNRLTAELRLQSPRPIIAGDLALLARRVTGVARALAIDGFLDGDYNVERATTVAVIDALGQPLDSEVRDEVEIYLTQRAALNSLIDVVDPVYVPIDVDAEIAVQPGQDEAQVQAAVEAAIAAFLSPAAWGVRGEDPASWHDTPVVRRNELVYALRLVPGVGYVGDVELNGSAADVDMAAIESFPAVLPEVGTVAVTLL